MGFPEQYEIVDKVRFDPIAGESRAIGKGEEADSSADPIFTYYRSRGKIPLLTREQEIHLAKKIESAKLNKRTPSAWMTLRCLFRRVFRKIQF
jgi:hypothetical protein